MEATTSAWPQPCDTRLPRCLLFAALITASADWLFYDVSPGASIAVFTAILVGSILLNRRTSAMDPTTLAILLLIPGAAIQSIIEISFSNILVLSLLLIALTGQTFYEQLPEAWTRWVEALLALFKSIGRWFWVAGELKLPERNLVRSAIWWTRALLPVLILTAIFTLLLSFGNVIFGNYVETTLNTIIHDIEFPSFPRIFLWVTAATLSLAVLHPALAPVARRIWFGKPPISISLETVSLNSMRSILILSILNALFLAVNTIDALYLWINASLPVDVSYAAYVHNGVYNLITCVVISALVLTGIFDQPRQVIAGRWIHALGILWIVQNLFLVASVALRVKLYIDVYNMSSLRVYVFFFLMLVAIGFILLTFKILKKKSSHWLIFSNALATFALFYTVQFLNVDGWVADYNVTRWIENPALPLDVAYLDDLGAPAWLAMRRVAEDPRKLPASLEARTWLDAAFASEGRARQTRSWKSWQSRRSNLYWELVSR